MKTMHVVAEETRKSLVYSCLQDGSVCISMGNMRIEQGFVSLCDAVRFGEEWAKKYKGLRIEA